MSKRSLASLLFGLALLACDTAPITGDAGLADTSSPPDACVPTEASSEPVAVEGMLGTLAGTLEVPAGCPPFAVAVILSGSGSTDRNGNDALGGPDTYEMLAQGLREQGVATVRYDDHGIGGSVAAAPARVEDFRFELEIEDAGRWVASLRQDPRFDRVLFAGHSEGSLTALIAAQHQPVDAIVSLDGTSLRAGRLLIEQARGHVSADDLATLEHVVDELEAGRTVEAATLPASIADIFDPSVQPYLISWFAYDPMMEVTRTSVPLLVVHGTTDHLVAIAQASMLAGARPGTPLAIIEHMAHTLKDAGDDAASQHAATTDPTVPLAVGLIDRVTSFVRAAP